MEIAQCMMNKSELLKKKKKRVFCSLMPIEQQVLNHEQSIAQNLNNKEKLMA